MIISCPSCATRFTVGATSIPPAGRKVRCAKCGNTWHQLPAEESVVETRMIEDMPRTAGFDASPDDSFEDVRLERDAAPSKKTGKPPRLPLGWIALAATVAACAGGLVAARGTLVELWPSAFLLYETIGLAPEAPGAGLQLPPPKAEIRVRDGVSTLVLEGQILNPSGAEQAIPTLRAIPTDPSGKPLEGWTLAPSLKSLLPGEIAAYHGEHPVQGPISEVTVTFF